MTVMKYEVMICMAFINFLCVFISASDKMNRQVFSLILVSLFIAWFVLANCSF